MADTTKQNAPPLVRFHFPRIKPRGGDLAAHERYIEELESSIHHFVTSLNQLLSRRLPPETTEE